MTICSLDIPLQVLIRPFFNSNIRSCKPVLQRLLIIPHLSLAATYFVKYCHLLVLQMRAFTDWEPWWLSNWGFNHMSKVTRGQVSVELRRSIKFDQKADYTSHARGSECDILVYLLMWVFPSWQHASSTEEKWFLTKFTEYGFYVILYKNTLHQW